MADPLIEKQQLTEPRRLEDNQLISPGLTADAPPELVRLPSIADMKNMTTGELADVMEYYGVTGKSFAQMQTESIGYVTRMTAYPPNSLEWDNAINNLIDTQSKRGMLGMTRRISERWSTLDTIDGNINHEMVWITEGDDGSRCDQCAARAGELYTYKEWTVRGLPGSGVCDGGDMCRCELGAIE